MAGPPVAWQQNGRTVLQGLSHLYFLFLGGSARPGPFAGSMSFLFTLSYTLRGIFTNNYLSKHILSLVACHSLVKVYSQTNKCFTIYLPV